MSRTGTVCLHSVLCRRPLLAEALGDPLRHHADGAALRQVSVSAQPPGASPTAASSRGRPSSDDAEEGEIHHRNSAGAGGQVRHVNHSILTRLRDGDPAAFSDAFRAHADAVYRYAVWSSGNWATAEDVVSLTFLEAWRIRDRLRPEEVDSVRPWLLGIATNVLRNTARAARRHQRALARLPHGVTVPDPAEEVTARLADAEQISAARAALEGLRRSEREVFTLCVWGELDYAAAAEALGVPVGTVRSRLSRARAKLRRSVDQPATREREAPGTAERELPDGNGQIQRVHRLPPRPAQENPS